MGARKDHKIFLKISFASVAMGVAGWFLLHGELWKESGRSMEKAGYLSGVIMLCSALYFL